jgi:hypothetical protein
MEEIGSGFLGEIPFLLNRNCFHHIDAVDAEIFFLILWTFACPMKSLLHSSHRDGQAILAVEEPDTYLIANLEIMWIPYGPARFIFLH